jgi:hypothetical protein
MTVAPDTTVGFDARTRWLLTVIQELFAARPVQAVRDLTRHAAPPAAGRRRCHRRAARRRPVLLRRRGRHRHITIALSNINLCHLMHRSGQNDIAMPSDFNQSRKS